MKLRKNNDYRVLRGASFDIEPGYLRSTFRFWYSPSLGGWVVGFRLVIRKKS